MSFKDTFTPTGYVVIKDKYENTIYEGFNTITNSGKTFILEKLFSALDVAYTDNQSNEINDSTNREFYGLCFSNNLSETTLIYDIDPKADEYPEMLKVPVINEEDNNETSNTTKNVINPLFFAFNYNTKEGFDPEINVANYNELIKEDEGKNARRKVSSVKVCFDTTFNKYYVAMNVTLKPTADELEILKNNIKGNINEPIIFVSSIGILLSQPIESKTKQNTGENTRTYKKELFSRFRFDAIPLTVDSEFSITYYIYI